MMLPFFNTIANRRDRDAIANIVHEYEYSAFVEPFFSTLNILSSAPPVELEVIGVTDDDVIDFLKALRDESSEVLSRLKKSRYCKTVFERSLNEPENCVENGIASMIRCGMSVGFRGEKFSVANESKWKKIVSDLPEFASRIQGVRIIKRPPIEIINAFSEQNYLCIAVPPIDLSASARKALFKSLSNYRGEAVAIIHESWSEPEKWKLTTKYGSFNRVVQQNSLEED